MLVSRRAGLAMERRDFKCRAIDALIFGNLAATSKEIVEIGRFKSAPSVTA